MSDRVKKMQELVERQTGTCDCQTKCHWCKQPYYANHVWVQDPWTTGWKGICLDCYNTPRGQLALVMLQEDTMTDYMRIVEDLELEITIAIAEYETTRDIKHIVRADHLTHMLAQERRHHNN